MNVLTQAAKSKTIQGNIWLTLIIQVLDYYGIDIPADVLAYLYGVGNIILRYFTDKAVKDK